tara:strand:+ start:271 stop:846 length:576 start_codon:yes stop_codon:yes gene_type:complete
VIVVKLGGSLYNSPELKHWLQSLVETSISTPIVIVPGGGPFADQVREAQTLHHFDDSSAHHMALMAMKQFGLMLIALEAKCQPFNALKLEQSLSVWLPDDSLLMEPSLTHSWDVTSDSLSLWLASKLDAEQLFLVKHIQTHTGSIQKLTADHVIDRHFADLFAIHTIPTRIIHYQSYVSFANNNETNLYLA